MVFTKIYICKNEWLLLTRTLLLKTNTAGRKITIGQNNETTAILGLKQQLINSQRTFYNY